MVTKRMTNTTFEDVIYAGWEEKDFELRYIRKLSGWDLNQFIMDLDNPNLRNMNFIDQYGPGELSDDIYFDGIEVLQRIESEEKSKNSNNDDFIPDDIGEAIIKGLKEAFNK